MVQLKMLGPPTIVDSTGCVRELGGHKPWAVLARVLLSERPLTRRELSAELFNEAADPLGALRWCLARIRRAIGSPELFTGNPIRAELPSWVTVDLWAVGEGRLDLSALGELLEGMDPAGGPEFSTWLLVARQQVAARIAARLREETITAISRGDHRRAIELAEAAARRSPYDEGAQVLLVKSLTAAGHTEAALAHVVEVERLFRAELGCEPTPALRSAARSSVAASPPGVSRTAIASGLLDAGLAALAAGAVDAGLECLRRAQADAERSGDDALFGRCLFELGTALVHTVRGFDDEGSVLLEQAATVARAVGDLPTTVGALRERGFVNSLAGRRPEAKRHLDLAVELAGDATELLAGVRAVAGVNLSDWGRYDESLAEFETSIDLARSAGDRRWEGWALGLGGWTALVSHRLPMAVAWLGQSIDVVRSQQWTSFEPLPLVALAEANLAGGDHGASTEELERCFAVSCHLEDPCWEGASARMLALHHLRAGDHDAAISWIIEARTRATNRTEVWAAMIGAILATEAEIRGAAGDAAGADQALRELIGHAARTHLDAYLHRAVTSATGSAQGPGTKTLNSTTGETSPSLP